MPASVNVNGTWRAVSSISVNVSGTWRTVLSGSVNVANTWRNFFSSGPSPSGNIALSTSVSPFINSYPWSSSGFGTRSTPSTTNLSAATGVAHTSSNLYNATTVTRFISRFSGTAASGTVTVPTTQPAGASTGISAKNNSVAVVSSTSPFLRVYNVSSGFSSSTIPSTLITGATSVNGVSIAVDTFGDGAVFVAASGTPHIHGYEISQNRIASGKLSGPSTALTSNALCVAANSASDGGLANALFVGTSATPFLHGYRITSGTNFSTKFSNPSTSGLSQVNALAVNSTNNRLLVAVESSPFVYSYTVTTTAFSTRAANPTTLPPARGKAVAFNGDNSVAFVGHDSSPFVSAYNFSGGSLGTKFANPATLPSGNVSGLSFR